LRSLQAQSKEEARIVAARNMREPAIECLATRCPATRRHTGRTIGRDRLAATLNRNRYSRTPAFRDNRTNPPLAFRAACPCRADFRVRVYGKGTSTTQASIADAKPVDKQGGTPDTLLCLVCVTSCRGTPYQRAAWGPLPADAGDVSNSC